MMRSRWRWRPLHPRAAAGMAGRHRRGFGTTTKSSGSSRIDCAALHRGPRERRSTGRCTTRCSPRCRTIPGWRCARHRIRSRGATSASSSCSGPCSPLHRACSKSGPATARSRSSYARVCARSAASRFRSDSARLEGAPGNFGLVIYDGFAFPLRANSFDLAFSDQLVEHLHPDDVESHFRAVADTLTLGGTYVFRTPHRFTGPHDISRHFTTGEAEGFHLKEWTYRELVTTLGRCGYSHLEAIWNARGISLHVSIRLASALETVLGLLPRRLRRVVSSLTFPRIVVAARR